MNADTNLPQKPDCQVCVQVCTLCMETASRELYEKLCDASKDLHQIKIEPVECMAVCDNPTTIAFRAPEKWSYVIGGVGTDCDVVDIIQAALAVAKSPLGIPQMNERPPFFRNGVICRLPPQNGS